MRRVKTLLRVSKKIGAKAAKGQVRYKGQSPHKLAARAIKYGVTFGPKGFVKKVKQELISIDKSLGSNLVFPNGLVTGVKPEAITSWYKKQGKPVTIVIPSYNDLNVLIPCLESIAKTTDPVKTKVIVVDDYCKEAHRKKMRELENEQVSVIFRQKNGGFAKAVNTGLEAADKRYDVILVNSDIVAHSNWLEAMQYGAYVFGEKTGIVGPKLLYPDGRIQSAGSHRNTEAPQWFDHYYRFQESNYGPANIPQYCIGVTGACMYVKREFINKIGLLDDKFQFAFEDMDWCIRGWDAGFRTLYFPAATLTHVESATRSKNTTISEKEKQSIKYFWEKWSDWFDARNVKDEKGRVRIIFVLQTMGMSGGIKIVFEHAVRLAERGFNIEVWGMDWHGRPWEISDKVKIRTFKNYSNMTKELEKEEAIKVATWWETAFPVWLASVKKGIPVYFIQEFETWFYPDDVVSQATVVSCYRKEFKNMTTSQYNLNEIRSLGLTAKAIPCGYDDDTYKRIKGVQRFDDTLLAVGRRFFQKNFDMTFRAWRAMGDKRPTLQLFGVEPDMVKLDKKITYREKPSNEQVNKLYNQSTVFVQTSRHEGFSLPILEAMAAGCPVICTDAHGNRDFCTNGKNCIIVEHDDIVGLTRSLNRLFKNKGLRDKLAQEGLKTAKKYRWGVVMDKVEAFYKEVAK